MLGRRSISADLGRQNYFSAPRNSHKSRRTIENQSCPNCFSKGNMGKSKPLKKIEGAPRTEGHGFSRAVPLSGKAALAAELRFSCLCTVCGGREIVSGNLMLGFFPGLPAYRGSVDVADRLNLTQAAIFTSQRETNFIRDTSPGCQPIGRRLAGSVILYKLQVSMSGAMFEDRATTPLSDC
jgi:hypothetical protein